MEEQVKAVKGITSSAANVSKQIKLIASANKGHSVNAGSILEKIEQVRQLSAKNKSGAERIRSIMEGAEGKIEFGGSTEGSARVKQKGNRRERSSGNVAQKHESI
jgi:methyl-accepting chemotaxis protein